jgi:predicted alpha-1,2-mannosidase
MILKLQLRYLFNSVKYIFLTLCGVSLTDLMAQKVGDNLEPVDLVEPLVDAANSRWFFFNSATRPFGMVNLSPDMVISGAWNSGYRYNQDTIRSFSHIHAWQLSGIPVFPTVGPFKGHLGSSHYGSTYTHDQELAQPGYHQVFLKSSGIDAELASTTRVGMHRYTFPESEGSHIHFDFSTFLGPCDTEMASVKRVDDQEIEGYALMAPTRRRPKSTYVYFVARIDKPGGKISGWKANKLLGEVEELSGADTGVYFSFSTSDNEEVQLKVAISYTGVRQARLNLESELSHWDFDKVKEVARQDWNQWLSKIEVKGGDLMARKRFYTDLWHALQGRRIISDVDGKYCDMTGDQPRIGQIPIKDGKPIFNHYNSDSFWGAQWTLNTLWHLVYPRVSEEFVQSMLLMYRDGGLIPRGPSGGNYTYVMTGASSTPFIVSAYQKGIRNFDIEVAYKGLVKNHLPGGIMSKAGYEHNTYVGGGLSFYLDRGFIPHPLPKRGRGFHEDGSGQTLENAYQDWTLAQLADALGHDNDAYYFTQRAKNYKNIWHPEHQWMWVKDSHGDWDPSLDILTYGRGWVEGNAAQFTWWVPHDVAGLIELMGGKDHFVDRLNTSFEKAESHDFTSGKSHDAEVTRQNRRTYINYGNQPSMHTAHLFNYAGAPWLTQYWSRKVIDRVYSGVSPQYGYSGDEDQGLMGSLAVLLKVGLFSMKGGCATKPIYEFGSPIFDKITLKLDQDYYPGETFVIEAKGNSAENLFIQSATLNGGELDRSWMYHEDLIQGGHIIFNMGSEPNKKWGSKDETLPLSLSSSK